MYFSRTAKHLCFRSSLTLVSPILDKMKFLIMHVVCFPLSVSVSNMHYELILRMNLNSRKVIKVFNTFHKIYQSSKKLHFTPENESESFISLMNNFGYYVFFWGVNGNAKYFLFCLATHLHYNVLY